MHILTRPSYHQSTDIYDLITQGGTGDMFGADKSKLLEGSRIVKNIAVLIRYWKYIQVRYQLFHFTQKISVETIYTNPNYNALYNNGSYEMDINGVYFVYVLLAYQYKQISQSKVI